MTSMVSHALDYAARGWRVFPAPPGEKKSHKKAEHSAGRRWGATDDHDEIRRDFARWPAANIGVTCGPESGVFVVEADTLDGHGVDGIANLSDLIERNGGLPETVEGLSPSGSRHLYFRWPESAVIKNSEGKIAPGIDVRGEGGMVIAAPSIKPGRAEPYRWVNPPGTCEIADCPDWLLQLCVEKPKPVIVRETGIISSDDDEAVLGWLYTRPNSLTRADWVRLCMSLKGHFGERAKDAWLSFSTRYTGETTDGEARRQWETANPDGRASIATAVHLLGGYERRERQYANESPPPREDGDPGWMPQNEAQAVKGEGRHLRPGFNPITGDTIEEDLAPELLPLADLASWATTAPSPKPFLMAGHIPEREVTLITAIGGGTKSTFGHQLCVSSAAGRQMLGVDVQPAKAFYLTAEDDFDRLHWMHLHICAKVGVSQTALFDQIQLSSVRGRTNNELATFDSQNRIRATPAFAQLKATLAFTGAKLLVLDNVAHLFAGNENDRVQVTAFVNLLYSLCRDLGVTVLLIAHPNKAGDAYSGSTAWPNAVRSHLVIEMPEGSLNPHERALKVAKANYAKPGEEMRFVWHDFALWLESEIPSDTRQELNAVIRANGERAAFLRCLAKATEDRRAVSHNNGTNYYARIFAAMPEGKGQSTKAFERAFERLLHLGEIKLDQPLWQDTHRHWKQGIAVAEKCGDPPAATPCGDLRRPTAQVVENSAATLRAATPPLSKDKMGAAPGSAAPFTEDEEAGDNFLADWGSRSERGE